MQKCLMLQLYLFFLSITTLSQSRTLPIPDTFGNEASALTNVISSNPSLSRKYNLPNRPYFDYITIAEGLPHNTVYCMMQDKNGFMWFGTQDGLVRYDGYNCQIFRQNETDSIGFQGKSVHCLLLDKSGNLWAGTQTEGINIRYYNNGTFKNLKSNPLFADIAKTWIKSLFEDSKGRIWIGTIGKGVLIFDPQYNTIKRFDSSNSSLKDNYVTKVVEDHNGTIWIGTNGRGIYYYDQQQQNFQHFHSQDPRDKDFDSFRKTFFVDKTGHLWVGTEGSGLYQISIQTLAIKHFTKSEGLASDMIMGIAEDINGNLLLATDGGGLNIFNPQSLTVEAVYTQKDKNSINTNALFDILVDKHQNIWISTYNGGINVAKKHKTWFETYTRSGNKAGELSHRSIISLCNLKDSRILIGTDGGGLNMLDKTKSSIAEIDNNPKGYGNIVKTIFEDSQNRIWLGYFNDGLSLWNKTKGTFRHFRSKENDPLSISGNNVWSIAEGRNRNLYIGVLGGGLSVLNPTTFIFKQYRFNPNSPNSISSDDVITVLADNNDRIWIGTNIDGLNIFDTQSEQFTPIKHESQQPLSLSANDVRCIFQDSKGQIWVGTESAGLNLWLGNGNRFEHFTMQKGLLSNAIMGIQEDEKGYLWISTFKGISRFDTHNKTFLNFDFQRNPAFSANQFNQSAITKDTEGGIYFGGINGLTFIHPADVALSEEKPNVVLTDFKIFNQSVSIGAINGRTIFTKPLEETSEITLSYYDNVFSLEFAALDFTQPLNNQYAYMMEGFDKYWQKSTSEQRLITYTNLDPGKYTFRIKGTNSNGIWSDEKAINIIITPPFWKTWWFKLFLFLALTAMAWLALRIYTARREMALSQKVLESERAILTLTNENLASEQVILQLQNEKLASEVQAKNAELMSKAAQTAHKNEILIEIKDQVDALLEAKETDKGKALRGLKTRLNTEIEGEKNWEQFTLYFDQIHQNFSSELLKKHPTLTPNDLRMCALTRLNMSNKEMAVLLNISVLGVEKSRYRLKKRLNLSVEDDLDNYLREF